MLWQTDLTSAWCGEDGWAQFCAVIDCFDRSIGRLGRSPPAAGPATCHRRSSRPGRPPWPHGSEPGEEIVVVCRHDNGTQFTSNHYRDVALGLGIKLSRTAYRHPDGNAFVERLYRTLKEECVWHNEFASFDEALAAITAWVTDYNEHRPTTRSGTEPRPRQEQRP
jgi:putative transposase